MSTRRITIFDTTLRDGEQSPGIALHPHEKAEIAAQLERLGVDVIEAGFPISSPGDFEGVRSVVAAARSTTVAALARSELADIDACAEALAGATRSRIHVFIATSPLHMERKLQLEPGEVLERVGAVGALRGRARRRGRVLCRRRHALGARVPRAGLQRGGQGRRDHGQPAGHGRQRACPRSTAPSSAVSRNCARSFAASRVSVHCHNDLGLAVANTLTGIAAGASQVECTVNGIGERAGNAALEEIVMALRVRGDQLDAETGIRIGEIGASSALVSRLTGYAVQRNKAIVGANAFAHEAGIHQDGMLKDTATYQIMDPEELGLKMTLPLGKHSGRHAFVRACADAGIELGADELRDAFARFKRLADERKAVTLYDVFEEVPVR